jgi:hypothetical protein
MGEEKKSVIVIFLFGFLVNVNITHGCYEADDHGHDGYKYIGSVCYILFEHNIDVYLPANLVFIRTTPSPF